MDRREAVKSVAFLIGGALSATTIATLFDSCTSPGKNGEHLFSPDHEKLISEIADVIIPTTAKSPGAKAAGVGPFISLMVKDCYPEDAQLAFVEGLNKLENKAKKDHGKSFLQLDESSKHSLISQLREETIASQNEEKTQLEEAKKQEQLTHPPKSEKEQAGNPMAVKEKPKTKPQFFAIIRDLSILGFFTSEIGATQAYDYLPIPGRYDGCVDLKEGQRLWA